MLIILDDLGAQYTKIRGDAARAGGGCSVLLLVAPDCDSLCAARILTTLFKGDSLEFKMVGVAGYTDVQNEVNAAMAPTGGASAAGSSLSSSPLRSVIMINCGAVPKIDELLELPAGVTLYIIDSHRPIYHTNVRADGRIRVLTSMTRDALAMDTVPEAGDSDLEEEEEDEEDDSDDSGSGGSDDDDEGDDDDGESDRSSEGSGEGGEEAAEDSGAAAAAQTVADVGEGVGAGGSGSETGGDEAAAAGASGAAAAAADPTAAGAAAAGGGAAKRSRAEAAAASKEAARRKRRLRKAADAASDGAGSSDGEGAGDEAGADADFTDGAGAGAGARARPRRGGKAKRAAGGAPRGAKRRRTTRGSGGGGGDEDGSASGSSDGSDSEAGGGGKQQVDLQRLYRDMRRRRKRRHADYYGQGHHHAYPASYVSLCLAQALNRVRNDMLWLAIVGLTDDFLSERLDAEAYGQLHDALSVIVGDLNHAEANPKRHAAAASDAAAAAADGGPGYQPYAHDGAGGGAGATGWEDTSGKGNAGVRGFIAPSVEPRFVSHRFSSLYEAMFHSEYVSTRLETWRVEGGDKSKSKLDGLLALTGVRLEAVQRPWVSMPAEDRAAVMRKLKAFSIAATVASSPGGAVTDAEIGWDVSGAAALEESTAMMVTDRFDLSPQMFYRSFTYTVDMEPEVSAADVVHGINGLLGAGNATPALLEHVRDSLGLDAMPSAAGAAASQGAGSGGSSGGAAARVGSGAGGGGAAGGAVLSSWAGHSWKDNWLAAWEALSSHRKLDRVIRGISHYSAMRRALMRLGNTLVRSSRIANGKLVRTAVVDSEAMTDFDRRIFTQPIALAALGRYIVKLCRDSLRLWRSAKTGRTLSAKPLILFVAYPHTPVGRRWMTVHGLPVAEDWGAASSVSFLDAFQSAARDASADFMMDSFDSATLLLDADHKTAFMEALDPSN